jgi:rfaE bifunctional protein nucleotidyltransferase chain/domain
MLNLGFAMQNLADFLAKRKAKQQSLVLVTGVFDLLHQEHLNFLGKAKAIADLLLVGLESDVRVRKMKGEGRPIYNQTQRLLNLEKLQIADQVFILHEEFSKPADHERLIEQIRPDFMAVSSNTAFKKEKEMILAQFGAKLMVVHEFNPEFSSTKLINNLKQKGQL